VAEGRNDEEEFQKAGKAGGGRSVYIPGTTVGQARHVFNRAATAMGRDEKWKPTKSLCLYVHVPHIPGSI